MSHYTVAVFTKNPDDIESMLEPYDENREVDAYIYKTADEVIEEYKKNNENPNPDKKTLIEWAKDWYGGDVDGECNVYSTYNPDSKWDWYQEGGRWDGLITLKNGKKVNRAKIKDIDFMADKKNAKLIEDLNRQWDESMQGKGWYKPEYYIQMYKDVQGYIDYQTSFHTYAVLDENGWHEAGRMGWFGMSSATPEQEGNWDRDFYQNFIANADPEMWMVIVDCHI